MARLCTFPVAGAGEYSGCVGFFFFESYLVKVGISVYSEYI